MIIAKIVFGLPARIPFEADRLISASIGDDDISNKYSQEEQRFKIPPEDTENMSTCELNIEYEKDGKELNETICIEVARRK